MGYYSDSSCAYEGQGDLLTLRQLIAGEGGNANHEAVFTYLMGNTFGPRYRDRRAGQMFLLVATPLMRVLGAWDSYQWELEYMNRMQLVEGGEPLHPMAVVNMLNAVDGVQLSPYMLSVLSRGLQVQDATLLDIDKVRATPTWGVYEDIAGTDDTSLSLQYITRELGYSSHTSIAVHNLVMGALHVQAR